LAETGWLVGVSTASHAAPAWVMANGWPAMVSVAERGLVVLFACTE
jgi:hypothetical protein